MPPTTDTSQYEKAADKAVKKVSGIAALPAVTVKIMEIVEDPDSQAQDLEKVVKNDPALAAKILKVVNSSFYGLPGQVANMDRAIVLLGLSAVQNIAIASSITRLFKGGKINDTYSADDQWAHSVGVAVAARLLALAGGNRGQAEEAFLAGLVHDLGLLVELQVYGNKVIEVINRTAAGEASFLECERLVLGVDHQFIGSALAKKWKFPSAMQACIGHHHDSAEMTDEARHLVALIHLADVICCQQRVGFELTAANEQVTPDLLLHAELTQENLDKMLETFKDDCDAAQSMLTD